MSIQEALLSDLDIVKNITEITISEIYPHYYPKGAVEFFLEHHREENIVQDIQRRQVFLCLDAKQNAVGTVTIKANEICRLFVLPAYQGKGYGAEMLDYAEKIILSQYPEVRLDASLPAREMYRKRGYQEAQFHTVRTSGNDFLCYDVMVMQNKSKSDGEK